MIVSNSKELISAMVTTPAWRKRISKSVNGGAKPDQRGGVNPIKEA
jgi:hypothetical protein